MKKIAYIGIVLGVSLMFAGTVNAASLSGQFGLGATGPDVFNLQTFLAADRTLYPEGIISGYYGPLTQAAVARFQSRNGLATVGRVGPLTLAALNSQMSGMVGTGDITSPIVSSLSVGTTQTTAVFNWNTNEASTATLFYSTTPIAMTEASETTPVVIGGTPVPLHTDFRVSHGATVTGFQPNTMYYYVLHMRDSGGNETVIWPSTFQTSI